MLNVTPPKADRLTVTLLPMTKSLQKIELKADFEKSFQRLEQLVQEFEQGDLDLEVGLEKFKEALKLAGICKKRLDEVENKVIKIKQDFAEVEK